MQSIGLVAFLGVVAWRLRRKMLQKIATSQSERPNVLVTGGAGYIGSHTLIILLEAGYDVTVVDNLCNSSYESIRRVIEITQCDPTRVSFHEVDMLNMDQFEAVFKNSPRFHSCIHFAALKAVGESMRDPILYYENNVIAVLNLLRLMQQYHCNKLIFSSSATVYGNAELPIKESSPTGCHITNAYGRTKYFIEEILQVYLRLLPANSSHIYQDFKTSLTTPFSITLLRYFNPIGAHPSGRIGEDPAGVPNNLMPFLLQVAVGRRDKLTVFGKDFDTVDGTGVRDYIHVMDVASGHLSALQYMNSHEDGLFAFNLGTGCGVSVLQMLHAMEKVIGRSIPYVIGARRPGDIDVCYADVSQAEKILGWKAKHNLQQMCEGMSATFAENVLNDDKIRGVGKSRTRKDIANDYKSSCSVGYR